MQAEPTVEYAEEAKKILTMAEIKHAQNEYYRNRVMTLKDIFPMLRMYQEKKAHG